MLRFDIVTSLLYLSHYLLLLSYLLVKDAVESLLNYIWLSGLSQMRCLIYDLRIYFLLQISTRAKVCVDLCFLLGTTFVSLPLLKVSDDFLTFSCTVLLPWIECIARISVEKNWRELLLVDLLCVISQTIGLIIESAWLLLPRIVFVGRVANSSWLHILNCSWIMLRWLLWSLKLRRLFACDT